jgi:hypothetical protein
MLPISQIKVGDMFQNPMFRGTGVIFAVEEIELKEKMVKIQSYSYKDYKPIMHPFWKKNTDRMFNESWRMR